MDIDLEIFSPVQQINNPLFAERGLSVFIKRDDLIHPFISGNKWLIAEGGRIGDFYIWQNLGVYQWDESNAYDANGVKLTPALDANGKPTGTYTVDGKPYTGTINKKSRNGIQ